MKKFYVFMISLLLVLSLSGVAMGDSNNLINSNPKTGIIDSYNQNNSVSVDDGSINNTGGGNSNQINGNHTNVPIKDSTFNTNIEASKNYGNNVKGNQSNIKGNQTNIKGDLVKGDKNHIKGDYYSDGSLKNDGVIDQSVNVPRDFPTPVTPVYPGFTNDPGDTTFANVQPVQTILMFGCEYNKTHLANMKSDGAVKTLQFSNIYGNENSPADTDTIIYIIDPKQVAGLKLKKIGTVVVKSRTGNTTTEQVLAYAGMQALKIKGAKYIYVSGEGFQKSTSALGVGLSLGYTYASVGGDSEDHGQVGGAGIGVAYGNTGRQADPYIQGIVLTDEKTFNEMMAPKPESK